VDGSGAFRLCDLMRTWGWEHGVSEQDILRAVRAHMFHSDNGAGHLRFAIDNNEQGHIIIRVQPKRQTGTTGDIAAGHSGSTGAAPGRRARMHGSVLMATRAEPKRCPLLHKNGQNPKLDMALDDIEIIDLETEVEYRPMPAAPAIDKNAKLDMALDEVIRSERMCSEPAVTRPARTRFGDDDEQMAYGTLASAANRRTSVQMQQRGFQPSMPSVQRARVHRAMEQMGWTAETRHLRRAPGMSAREGDRGGRPMSMLEDGRERRGRRGDLSAGERIQRFLGWVLKTGHRELSIPVEDGWAQLAQLAVAVSRAKPGYGDFDAAKLKAFIEETDEAGRFEMDAYGRIRKVEKDSRARRIKPVDRSNAMAGGASQPAPPSARPPPGARPGRVSLSPSSSASSRRSALSRSPSPMGDNMDKATDDADIALAEVANRSLRVTGDVEPVATEKEARAPADGIGTAGAPPPPPAPPGEHWTMYQDEDFAWWYYEGPLGVWWTRSETETPQPYEG